MNKPIQIVIAEDHPMFREGLRQILEAQDDFTVTGEAGNGIELMKLVEETKPDVVITDFEIPLLNGTEATKKIKEQFPDVRVIALTMYGEDHLIADMIEAGAHGYLLKTCPKEELQLALRTVYEGKMYFCNSTSPRLSKILADKKRNQGIPTVSFSEKEIEIIRLICQQYVSKEIADKTSLTHRTVEKYRDHIMEKTESRNVVGIVVYAIRAGIFKL